MLPKNARTIPYLDELLSDGDFYDLLDDINFEVKNLNNLAEMPPEEREKLYSRLNVEGYYEWWLQQYIVDFVKKRIYQLLYPEVRIGEI